MNIVQYEKIMLIYISPYIRPPKYVTFQAESYYNNLASTYHTYIMI